MADVRHYVDVSRAAPRYVELHCRCRCSVEQHSMLPGSLREPLITRDKAASRATSEDILFAWVGPFLWRRRIALSDVWGLPPHTNEMSAHAMLAKVSAAGASRGWTRPSKVPAWSMLPKWARRGRRFKAYTCMLILLFAF